MSRIQQLTVDPRLFHQDGAAEAPADVFLRSDVPAPVLGQEEHQPLGFVLLLLRKQVELSLICLSVRLPGCRVKTVKHFHEPWVGFVQPLWSILRPLPSLISASFLCRHALPLFTSLLNVVCAYDPVGYGFPYNYLLSLDQRERLVVQAIQVLIVTLEHEGGSVARTTLQVLDGTAPTTAVGEQVRG